MKTKYLSTILLIIVPVAISVIVRLVIDIQFIYILTAIFILMLFLMIPSDVFMRGSLDYQIKSINPSYKDEKPHFYEENKKELIDFIVVFIATVFCLSISLLSS